MGKYQQATPMDYLGKILNLPIENSVYFYGFHGFQKCLQQNFFVPFTSSMPRLRKQRRKMLLSSDRQDPFGTVLKKNC